MLEIGLSYLVLWLLVEVFEVELLKAILSTAIIFIVLGLLMSRGFTLWKKN